MRLSGAASPDGMNALERWFLAPIDARVYAAVRITYAVVCLSVVLETWPVRASLFSEDGMSWHRPDLLFYLPLKWVRSQQAVTWFMAAAGLASVLVGVGLFTRLALVFLYFWNFAYCAIGYPAESGYDGVARIVGFVLLFAPPARTWALDARVFGARAPEQPRYVLRLLQVQLAIVYVCTVWLKAPDQYWRNGELMAYFMSSMYSRFPFPIWASLGRTSVLMTWGALLAESAIPFCLFIPRLRRLGFALGLGLHGGIAVTSTIGMFSLAMVPLYAAFLTKEDLDDLARLVRWLARRGKPARAAEALPPAAADAGSV